MKRKPTSSIQKGFNRKPKGFDQKSDVRAIARERVGTVKPSRPILPPTLRKKPKHKRPPGELEE
jgi:hypothetical protein